MTTIHHSPAVGNTPFAIYEDPEDQEPLSPSEMYEGEMSFHSERSHPMTDEVIPSIELEQEFSDEPEPYRSSYTSRKSGSQPRRSSGITHYSFISAIPSESSISSKPFLPANEAGGTRYTPRKERPRFRNPESVRAMQMSSPPPLPAYEAERERMKGAYKLATPSRSGRSETPVSRRSGSRRESVREHHSPRPIPTPQQAPLVLLHVTILPMQLPYSHDLMARIMPDWLVENYKLLEEKLQDIILMRRGLLIPHPRDEYELLEERILESLELKTPRLLKCGHFVAPEEDTDREDEDDMTSITEDNTGRGSRMSGDTFTQEIEWKENMADDASVCTDCHREVKKPSKGVGPGRRKWDIKVYAANGLMRAAAWTACFNDMERCDVEIHPWIPEELRKALERRALEEQEAEKRKQLYAIELQRQIQEAAAKQKMLEQERVDKKRQAEIELQKSFETAAAALQRSVEEKAAERERFEEVLEEKIQEAKEAVRLELEAQALAESSAVAERFCALEKALKEQKRARPEPEVRPKGPLIEENTVVQPRSQQPSSLHRPRAADIPLSTLLKNYILVLLGDQRNLIIIILGALVVFLTMNMNLTSKQQLPSPQLDTMPYEGPMLDPVPAIATTTTTAISFSTLTVTEIQTATTQASLLPSAPVPVQQSKETPLKSKMTDAQLAKHATEMEDSANTSESNSKDGTYDSQTPLERMTSNPAFHSLVSVFDTPGICTKHAV